MITQQQNNPTTQESSNDVVISVKKVSKKFCKNLRRSMAYGIVDLAKNLLGIKSDSSNLRKDEFWAIDNICFELKKGEALGLLGLNGSGKTTLLRLIAGIFPPDNGEIKVKGKIGALIAVGAGFHPYMTGRENIYLNGSILGMSNEEINNKFEDIVEFAEIDDFLEAPVSSYSSGMRMRLGFSIATAIKPDLLLLDEILAVGDRAFRMKCFQRIGEIIDKSGVIFVSHDIVQISRICNKVMIIDKGKNNYIGETEIGIEKYLESNKQLRVLKKKLIKNDKILKFSCKLNKNILKYGESIIVELFFESQKNMEIGIALINISSNDTNCAQADISDLFESIKKGKSNIKIEIGPIYLKKDEYSISITMTDLSCKNTLVHSLNTAKFIMEGNRGYGICYELPTRRIIKKN